MNKELILEKLDYKMMAFYGEHDHDIRHYKKVWTYAKAIAELEGIDKDTKYILEVAAILHDIACPYLRSLYGHSDGKLQEIEGMPMAKEFLLDSGLNESQIDRVVYLVGHHHTLDKIDDIDYQILIEADYIVNAEEIGYPIENIQNMHDHIYKTDTGKRFLEKLYNAK